MRFIEQQKKARFITRQLVVAYALTIGITVVLTGLGVNVMVGYLDYQTGAELRVIPDIFSGAYFWLFWGSGLSMASVIVAVALRTSGTLRRYGGRVVAGWLRGVKLSSVKLDANTRRLRNVVEEIAVASGISVPTVYVVPDSSINAMAAGFSTRDACIFVNRGCLEQLSRSELQALIAHEFGHILNGDMLVKMRLVGPLAGLSSLVSFGRALYARSSTENNHSTPLSFTLPFSIPMYVVGFVGEYCARWIKHHILRQREYLADAYAVQFTRDPDSLLKLISKVETQTAEPSVRGSARHLTFMMFADPWPEEKGLSTHPSNLNRAKKVRPGFLATQFWVGKFAATPGPSSVDVEHTDRQPDSPPAVATSAATHQASAPVAVSEDVTSSIDALRDAAHNPGQAESVINALLATCPGTAPQGTHAAQDDGPDHTLDILLKSARSIDPLHRLPLASIAVATLMDHGPERRAAVLKTVQEKVNHRETTSLFQYTLSAFVTQQLQSDENAGSDPPPKPMNLHQARDSVTELLAIVCHFGHKSAGTAQRAFSRGLDQALPGLAAAYRPATNWQQRLSNSLNQLSRLDLISREILVDALIAACRHDGKIAPEEHDLISLICNVLGQPLPEVLAEQSRTPPTTVQLTRP